MSGPADEIPVGDGADGVCGRENPDSVFLLPSFLGRDASRREDAETASRTRMESRAILDAMGGDSPDIGRMVSDAVGDDLSRSGVTVRPFVDVVDLNNDVSRGEGENRPVTSVLLGIRGTF